MDMLVNDIQTGTYAVKKLREQKLRSGFPFMINDLELATNECYLEYPNGVIKLAIINENAHDMQIVRELTKVEADELRFRLQLSAF